MDDGSGGMDSSMTDFITELKCMVAGMQVAVNEGAPAANEVILTESSPNLHLIHS